MNGNVFSISDFNKKHPCRQLAYVDLLLLVAITFAQHLNAGRTNYFDVAATGDFQIQNIASRIGPDGDAARISISKAGEWTAELFGSRIQVEI